MAQPNYQQNSQDENSSHIREALHLMAHITIATKGGIADAKLVQALRGCIDGGLAHIATALRVGTPLFDEELFTRPREEQFAKVRRLLAVHRNARVDVLVMEDGYPIGVQGLLNIMQSSDDSMAHFDRLGDLEHEA